MQKETGTYNPQPAKHHYTGIASDRIPRMQGMEADTAPSGNKDLISQEMIQVYQHGSQHDQPGFLPYRPEKEPGNQPRSKKMQAVMHNMSQYISGFSEQNNKFRVK